VYTLSVQRDFIAQHFLIGGDWGAENELHSHNYRLEVQLQGGELDPHGYLVDIIHVESELDRLVESYRDTTLNEQPAFAGLNPSIEHFCRIACLALVDKLSVPNIDAITVRIWESQIAWASYRWERASVHAQPGT
jgi:6-pyruvoyltetrahydropterin/6-carboxytetrahydropterin synthase